MAKKAAKKSAKKSVKNKENKENIYNSIPIKKKEKWTKLYKNFQFGQIFLVQDIIQVLLKIHLFYKIMILYRILTEI